MKKLFISLVALTAAVAMNAEVNALKLILTSSTSDDCEVRIVENDAATEMSGIEMNMTGRTLAVYIINGNEKLQTVTANSIEDLNLGLLLDGGNSFTLTAAQVVGEPMRIYDAATGIETTLTQGASIEVSAASALVINPSAPAVPAICHEGQLLKVTNYNGIVKVDDIEYQVAGNLDIDIANLSAGHHTVNFDGQDLIINVR